MILQSEYDNKKERMLCNKTSALLAPQVGLEPTTLRLTAECSAIELLRQELNPATTYSPGPLPAKYHQRAEA